LDWLIALCRRSPDAYDFASIFRELEQVYRREGAEDAVGHVLVAAGALSEIAGDVDTALARYREAVEAAPQDLTPVFSLAELLVKLRRPEEACEALRAHASRTAESEHKLRALGRMAEVISNVMLDAERASAVYLEMLASDPGNSEASERLAQELYLLGRVDEAQRIMRALLDRAQADGTPARELSRYTHYLGVLLQRVGDLDGALEQFRRALQLDATNAAAVMALARQMVLTGDRGGAARLLERTIGESRETPSASAADLRRSLAGLYLGAGDVSAAVTCYEAVVRESAKLEDRLALAEALAGRHDTIPRARAVLREVIAEDATNLNALRLEAQLHGLSGEPDRELQVMKVVETLGGADDQELVKLATLRRQAGGFKLSGVLDDALRGRLCPPAVDVHVARLWSALREPLEKLFGQESPPAVRPLAEVGSPQLRQLCEWCMRLHGVSPSVQIGEDVPGGVLLVGDAAGRVVLDGLFLERPLPEVAFTLGRSLEYLRSGHALISRLAFDDRQLLAELLAGTLQAPASTAANDLVQEFKRGLPRRVTKAIDEVVASYRAQLAAAGEAEQPKRWLAHVDRAASNLGLLTCDDLGAALRMVAQLAGQELPSLDGGGGLAVRFISDGPELVKLFLSDEYLEVRRALTRV
jgi:tetratricopeptide (TPR) repeat protein